MMNVILHSVSKRFHSCVASQRRQYPLSVRRAAHAQAFTIVELLMALAITGLIGAAVASMLTAVSYGTNNSRDIRTLVVKNKTISARITAAIREATQLLDAGDNYIILWTDDINDSGAPDLLELRRINLNTGTRKLIDYTPDPDATDVAYDLEATDFDAVTLSLIDSDDMLGALWATDVTAMTVTLDESDPLEATLISFQVTISEGALSDTSVNAASLRD